MTNDVEAAQLIERIEGLPNYERAWALTLKGAGVISYVHPKRHFHRLSLVHDIKVSELRIALEGAGISHAWMPEHEIRSAMARKHGLKRLQQKSVPDGIMSVSYKGAMESVAIEVELHYKNKNRYQEMFRSYIGKENVKAVWYFVPSVSLGTHLARLWKRTVGNWGPWFFWSLVDEVLKDPCLTTIHYFDEKIEIASLFTPHLREDLPAHPGGSGVSSLGEEKSKNKVELNSETQGELPAKVI